MDMQKKLFLSAALGLAIFANTAFAEVNTYYLANELRSYPGWSLEVYCNATDVNAEHSLIPIVMLLPCCKGEINFM